MQELLENHKKLNCKVCLRRETRRNLLTQKMNNPFIHYQSNTGGLTNLTLRNKSALLNQKQGLKGIFAVKTEH